MPPLTKTHERRIYRELKDVRRRIEKDKESMEDLDPDNQDEELIHLHNRAVRYVMATAQVIKQAIEKPPPPLRDPRRLAVRVEPPQRAPNFFNSTSIERDGRDDQRIRDLLELEREIRRRMEALEEFHHRHSHDLEKACDALQKAMRAQDKLRDFIKGLERQRRRQEAWEAGRRQRARERRQAAPDQEPPPPPYQSVETLPRYQESPEGQTYEERAQGQDRATGAVSELVTAQLQSLNLR